MRLRIASVAFLLGTLVTGAAWLPVQPALLALLRALGRLAPPGTPEQQLVRRVQALLPVWLGLSLLAAVLVTFVVLYLVVGRPLRQTERLVERIGREEGPLAPAAGGPLLRRVQTALTRTATALAEERARTQGQLAALQEANARLARTQMELLSAERLATVGRLAAGVAHEVGNPLGGILGYLSLARMRAQESPGVTECLEHIEAEVHRIDGIVRSLLDVGRPRTGRPQPLELHRHVEATVRLVTSGADFTHVEVTRDVPEDLVARCEPGALSQVLINLLLNAAHAVEGRGRVHVAARRSREGEVALTVEDTGPGIAPEVVPRLFEPFFTTKGEGWGTGLGLAVARHLAEQQGGRLEAANGPGGGACFTLTLPAA